MALAAHFWTIAPNLIGRIRPLALDERPFSFELPDAQVLAGMLGDARRVDRLALVVHGLGGDASSPYMREIAAALERREWASLRISMRGAGESSADFYHAGLWSDLAALLAAPALAHYRTIIVIGCSLGGHVALHLARNVEDPRVRAVVAIGAPLDLAANVRWFEDPRRMLYCRHVLRGLEGVYVKLHGRRRRFADIREWDEQVVVPRWGFADADAYWASQTIGPQLPHLRVPALYVGALDDPMIPAQVQRDWLAHAREQVEAHWLADAGHVGFPPRVDLGMPGELGVWPQVLRWCERAC